MLSRVKRIEKIIDIAALEMDQAAKTMAYMRGKLQDDQAQLQSLLDYQQEYIKNPAQSGTIDRVQLQTHNAFSDKLVHALSSQQAQVEESEKMLQMAEQAWNEKRIRVKALEALLLRVQKNEQARLNKQEQRLLDELSTLRFANRST